MTLQLFIVNYSVKYHDVTCNMTLISVKTFLTLCLLKIQCKEVLHLMLH